MTLSGPDHLSQHGLLHNLLKRAVLLQSLYDLNICTEGQPMKWSQQAPKDQHLMLFVWLAGPFSRDKGVRVSSGP